MPSRLRWVSALGVAVGLWGWGSAAWAAPRRYLLDPQATTVRFLAHATPRPFTGIARAPSGRLFFDPQRSALLEPAEVLIPVASLRTGNYFRDRDMRVMFEAAQYPQIRVVLTRLTRLPDGGGSGAARYRVEGRLRIRTIEQPLACEVAAVIAGESLTVSGQVPVTITAFDLHPPRLPFGLGRVREDVLVTFTSRWIPQP